MPYVNSLGAKTTAAAQPKAESYQFTLRLLQMESWGNLKQIHALLGELGDSGMALLTKYFPEAE